MFRKRTCKSEDCYRNSRVSYLISLSHKPGYEWCQQCGKTTEIPSYKRKEAKHEEEKN